MGLTSIERAYIEASKDAITAVCDVNRYITAAHATQLDTLESGMSKARAEELREQARREWELG